MGQTGVHRKNLRDVLTTGQAARLCFVSPRKLNEWIDSGLLSGYRLPDGRRERRILRRDLVAFLQKHGMPLGDLESLNRVLLVGCEGRLQSCIENLFGRDSRLRIETASGLFEAGRMLTGRRPDCVLIDFVIGRNEALQLAQFLVGCPAGRPPVLGLVGEDEADPDGLLALGFAGVFQKPYDSTAVAARVGSLLASSLVSDRPSVPVRS